MLARLWRALGGAEAHAAALRSPTTGPCSAHRSPSPSSWPGRRAPPCWPPPSWPRRGAFRGPCPSLDLDHLAVAAASERHVRLDGAAAGTAFDPTSAFFAAADGWVRTHGNYEHHRAALLGALGVADPARLAVRDRGQDRRGRRGGGRGRGRLRRRGPVGGGVGGTPAGTPAGGRAGRRSGSSPARTGPPCGAARARRRPGALPCAGLRVLDLTRVIAGPVGTRMLAASRAPTSCASTRRGARSSRCSRSTAAWASARRPSTWPPRTAPAWLERELARADVVVDGFRPGRSPASGWTPTPWPRATRTSCTSPSRPGARPAPGARGAASTRSSRPPRASPWRCGRPTGATRRGRCPCRPSTTPPATSWPPRALRALTGRISAGRAGRARLALAATAQALLAAGPREARRARARARRGPVPDDAAPPGRAADRRPAARGARRPAAGLALAAPLLVGERVQHVQPRRPPRGQHRRRDARQRRPARAARSAAAPGCTA